MMLPALLFLSPLPPPLPTEAANSSREQPQLQNYSATNSAPPPPFSGGAHPSLLVVGVVILFVFFVSASIHLFLRFLSHNASSRSSPTSPRLDLLRLRPSSTSSYFSSATAPSSRLPTPPIDAFPFFTLRSSLAALPLSSQDCAVCLSRFQPDDQLRLLPSCRHAFHSTCIDTWLRSSLSCPLCRSPVSHEPPPTPTPPNAPPAAVSAGAPSDRSGSYRIEIGTVSHRSTPEVNAPEPQPMSVLSYSLGSSFEYVVEEEVEAVVTALAEHVRRQRQSKDLADRAPAPPGNEVAESAVRGEESRNWLRDYLDRQASSSSSSFSSVRFSERRIHCIDGAGSIAERGSWDPEGSRRSREEEEMAGAYYNAFYRWLVGA